MLSVNRGRKISQFIKKGVFGFGLIGDNLDLLHSLIIEVEVGIFVTA